MAKKKGAKSKGVLSLLGAASEEQELNFLQKEIESLQKDQVTDNRIRAVPAWMYLIGIFATYLFSISLAIYMSLTNDDPAIFMNAMLFLFVALAVFLLLTSFYLMGRKQSIHSLAAFVFFLGIAGMLTYLHFGPQTLEILNYGIILAVIVTAISMFILLIRRNA